MAKPSFTQTQAYQEGKRQLSLKNFYFNRYLMLRYATACFLFSNLYWLLLLPGIDLVALLPVSLLVLASLVCLEHLKLYGHVSADVRGKLVYHRYFYISQGVVNGLLIGLILTGFGFQQLLPMFSTDVTTRLIVGLIPLLGLWLAWGCVVRLHKIESNTDAFHAKLVLFEQSLGSL